MAGVATDFSFTRAAFAALAVFGATVVAVVAADNGLTFAVVVFVRFPCGDSDSCDLDFKWFKVGIDDSAKATSTKDNRIADAAPHWT